VLARLKVLGVTSNITSSFDVCENNSHKVLHYTFQNMNKSTLCSPWASIILHLRGEICGRIRCWSFVLQGSEGLTSDRILVVSLGVSCFVSGSSEDDSLVFSSISFRRLVSVRPIGPQCCFRAMYRPVLPKLQSLFHLAKIELWEKNVSIAPNAKVKSKKNQSKQVKELWRV
jgi:hypothetical protein